MSIPIGPFDAIELVNLGVSLIAFVLIYKAYRKGADDGISKKFWMYFLLIAILVLLGKVFDNLDDLAFEPYFNLMQHLSSVAAAAVFMLVTRKTLKGELNA